MSPAGTKKPVYRRYEDAKYEEIEELPGDGTNLLRRSEARALPSPWVHVMTDE
jgi:hypothetical protein